MLIAVIIKNIKERFDELKEEGSIESITFHQNFTYEDFIEGIKPELDNDDEDALIRYKIVDGIFKQISQQATKN